MPPRLEVEQRKFLNVHRKGGEACPRCGTRISEVKAGGFVTTWCRALPALSPRGQRFQESKARAQDPGNMRGESKRILATTYFPEELPPEYLRRWRA